jgi:hypothetical protein
VHHRVPALARGLRRVRLERVVLGLDGPTLAGVARARIALGDEPANTRLARGCHQCVGALGAQPVGLREAAVEVLEVAQIRQRGRLVDDRLRLGCEQGLAHGARVEQIEHDRLRSERAYALGPFRRRCGADDLVPPVEQLWHESGADRAARSDHEDSHLCSPSVTSA